MNFQKKDECEDTADTDSYESYDDKVLENAVFNLPPSEVLYSNDSSSGTKAFYSNDSSSGTEKFRQTHTTRAIFYTSPSEMNDLCSSIDTEESEMPTNVECVELRRVHYWSCVKCDKHQNNPMYRYCQRCYQIRKSQFSPRPKHDKKRTKTKKYLSRTRRSVNYSSNDLESSDGGKGSSTAMQNKYNSRKRITSKMNSADETGKSTTTVENETVKEGRSSSNAIIKNVFSNQMAKDSGFSLCSSNQESTTDFAPIQSFVSRSRQATFCSEYEDINALNNHRSLFKNAIHKTKSFDSTVSSTITSRNTNLSKASTSSTFSSSASASTSSGLFSDDRQPESQSPTLRDGLEAYLPCMFCLTHPKNSVFVHTSCVHLCCCYRCAVKVWYSTKRCPICKGKVNNILKIFIH